MRQNILEIVTFPSTPSDPLDKKFLEQVQAQLNKSTRGLNNLNNDFSKAPILLTMISGQPTVQDKPAYSAAIRAIDTGIEQLLEKNHENKLANTSKNRLDEVAKTTDETPTIRRTRQR